MMSRKEYALLRWAITEASAWRGTLIGHPDATDHLILFDSQIEACYQVIKKYSPYMKKRRPSRGR